MVALATVIGAVGAVGAAGAVGAVGAVPMVTSENWGWPVAPPHPIVRTFSAPATPYSAGHRGIDIGGVEGTVVVAPADGIVSFAGVVVDRPVVSIRHDDGVVSSYEPVSTSLVAGTPLRRGEAIGTLRALHCTEPCLHFGTRRFGQYVSPLGFLGEIGPSVLLPTREISLTG